MLKMKPNVMLYVSYTAQFKKKINLMLFLIVLPKLSGHY